MDEEAGLPKSGLLLLLKLVWGGGREGKKSKYFGLLPPNHRQCSGLHCRLDD